MAKKGDAPLETYKSELMRMFDLQKFGMKLGLDSMKSLLGALGNPHLEQKFIHLAGTNGKGSTGVMLLKALSKAGYRVGLYTSPHLVTFRERIRIASPGETGVDCDGADSDNLYSDKLCSEMISQEKVLELNKKLWEVCDPSSPPTFFEFVTAMAFLYFKDMAVDLAIIETGLGGRLDSTNVITPVVAAITNVSLEHTEHLGDTIAQIASEKAGIIKPGRPVVVGPLEPEALKVVEEAAQNSQAYFWGRDFKAEASCQDSAGRATFNFTMGQTRLENVRAGLAGPHQVENAALALATLEALAAEGFPTSLADRTHGVAQAAWPGRAETFAAGTWPPFEPKGRGPLLLDGAHNPAGAEALARMLEAYPRKRLHLIIGAMADKDIAGILEPIYKLADRLYLTRPEFSRAASPEKLQEILLAAFGEPQVPCALYPGIPAALAAAATNAGAEDLVLLSGSLFTVGEGRAYLEGIDEVESN